MTDFAELYRTMRSSSLSCRAFCISCFVHSKRNCLSPKRWCCKITPIGFAQVLRPPNPYQKLRLAYTTSADRVGWKRFGQLQVTCLPCFRSAEVLIVNATVCKLPAVFRNPVDELFQNARHRFCLNDLNLLPDLERSREVVHIGRSSHIRF
jgi:hypothetical protein